MITATLDHYLSQSSICPTDSEVGLVVTSSDWWSELKSHFDDIVWLYYADRYLFLNKRFSSDDETINAANIRRAFAIWIKSKKRLIDRLYVGYMSDFNPLWNVDGVEGTVSKTAHSGSVTDTHTGNDTTDYEDNGSLTYSGTDTDTLSGTDTTGNENTTFDSGNTFFPHDKSGTQYGKVNTHTRTDRSDTRDYDGFKSTTYDSELVHDNDLLDEHVELNIRQGNIGVTKSTDLVGDNQKLYMEEYMDLWKWIVRMCVNQVSYSIEGV